MLEEANICVEELSGIASAVYYRHEITKSARNFLLIGVGRIVGAFLLGYLFVAAGRVVVAKTAGLGS